MRTNIKKPDLPFNQSPLVALAVYLRRLIFYIAFVGASGLSYFIFSLIYAFFPYTLVIIVSFAAIFGALAIAITVADRVTLLFPPILAEKFLQYEDESYEATKLISEFAITAITYIFLIIVGLIVLNFVDRFIPLPIPIPNPIQRTRFTTILLDWYNYYFSLA
jgi:hypothetical protein